MAAPHKQGLDYFSHDTNMQTDKKIRLLKARAGIVGYAIYMMFLEELYKTSGYYLEINKDYLILFAFENKIDIEELKTIIDYFLNYDLFDKNLYEKYKILTSKRIQKNYLSVIERRKKVDFIQEYLLLNPDDIITEKSKCYHNVNINSINDDINSINVNINPVNDNINPQSKVKESKVKKSKDKEKDKEKRKERIFQKPTIEEIKNYVKEKKLKYFDNGEVENFFYFYESKNWFVGKNKMKNWHSAVGGWNVRNKQKLEKGNYGTRKTIASQKSIGDAFQNINSLGI